MCDPSFPLLRDDDCAVSKALYDKQLSQHYTDLDLKIQIEKGFIDFPFYLFFFFGDILFLFFLENVLKSKKPVRPTSIPLNLQPLGKDLLYGLKPIYIYLFYPDRKPMLKEDIMTPLMAKLSMSESYSFAASTESICRTPSTSFQPQTNTAGHQKLSLFVAGFMNTSIMVLLEKEAENDADLIHLLVNNEYHCLKLNDFHLYLQFVTHFLYLVETMHQHSWKFRTSNRFYDHKRPRCLQLTK